MTTPIDTFEFQKGLVTALRAKSTLTTLLASLRVGATDSGIYDAPPQGAKLPYLIVGEGTEQQTPYFGADARELLADVEIWTADGEATTTTTGAVGYRQGSALKVIVEDVLMNDTISASGCTVSVLAVDTTLKQRDDTEQPAARVQVVQATVLLEAD